MPKLFRVLPWFLLAIVVIIADQISKIAVVDYITQHGNVTVIDGFFNLVLAYNKGAAFSFLSSAGGWQRYILLAFAILVSIWLIYMIWRSEGQKLTCFALALVLGGAIGNVIDRARLGAVVDFIDWHIYDKHYPTFNVADIGITVGVALLLLEAFLSMRKAKRVNKQ